MGLEWSISIPSLFFYFLDIGRMVPLFVARSAYVLRAVHESFSS